MSLLQVFRRLHHKDADVDHWHCLGWLPGGELIALITKRYCTAMCYQVPGNFSTEYEPWRISLKQLLNFRFFSLISAALIKFFSYTVGVNCLCPVYSDKKFSFQGQNGQPWWPIADPYVGFIYSPVQLSHHAINCKYFQWRSQLILWSESTSLSLPASFCICCTMACKHKDQNKSC